MTRKLSVLLVPALFALGCDDTGNSANPVDMSASADLVNAPHDANGGDGGGGDGGGDGGMSDGRPVLGAQIDRMGRPAINTALTDPFNFDGMHDQTQDAYNAASDPTKWATMFAPRIAANLAILDVLDGVCGNQVLYNAANGGAMFTDAGYTGLATVLADDELYVNTSTGMCTGYLAVEAAFVMQKPNNDCGGRAPTYDVIDASYTVLSGSMKTVSDGVNADPDNAANNATFPFLGAPNM